MDSVERAGSFRATTPAYEGTWMLDQREKLRHGGLTTSEFKKEVVKDAEKKDPVIAKALDNLASVINNEPVIS